MEGTRQYGAKTGVQVGERKGNISYRKNRHIHSMTLSPMPRALMARNLLFYTYS